MENKHNICSLYKHLFRHKHQCAHFIRYVRISYIQTQKVVYSYNVYKNICCINIFLYKVFILKSKHKVILLYHMFKSQVNYEERNFVIKPHQSILSVPPFKQQDFFLCLMCQKITSLECNTLMKTSLIKSNFSLVMIQSKCIIPSL